MTKTVRNILSSKIAYFLLLTSIILSLNLTPLILQILHAPPGRTFALVHNNVQDFFFYQSLMNEGANGQWLTTDPYTSEPHQSSIIFSYFLWLGKIAGLLNLPYAVIYHFLRIILSILFLFTVYYFLYFIKIPHPRLTYFFFLFAAPFMRTYNENGRIFPAEFMYWWTGMDPLRRAAYLPHHMFGALLLILSLILIIKYQKKSSVKYLIMLSFTALLLAFIHTPSLFILLLVIPPAFVIFAVENSLMKNFPASAGSRQWREKLQIKNCFPLIIYWIIGLLALFIMISQTSHGFPWSQYIDWEKRYQFPLDKELLGALGILVPFTLIGLIISLLSKKFIPILIACWFVIPFLFIPFAPILGISNIRLIQGVPYLPLSILAVFGINSIIKKTSSIIRINKFSVVTLLHCCIIILFLIFTLPTLSWSLSNQIKEFWPIYGNVYLDNRLKSAFNFINANFPPKTVTLATFYTGNYLPAFTHTVSFIGHTGYTSNLDLKQDIVSQFYQGNMSLQDAKLFISKNNIKLIFQGPEEKPIYSKHLYPEILKPVYDKEEATVYILLF